MTREEMARAYADGFEDKDYREIAYNAFLCGYGAKCDSVVPGDLDEAAENYAHSLGYDEDKDKVEIASAKEDFVAGAEWMAGQAEKETIERACNWLFSHLPILVDCYNEDIHEKADRGEFIKLFRKSMEDEK